MSLTVDALSFRYPTHQALANVSFALPKHSVTALIGPNGAGKSTLMRCIAGLLRPSNGAVRINDVEVAAAPREAHKRLGFLEDNFGLYDALTVKQCLIYAAKSRGVADENVTLRVTEVATQLEISAKLDARVGELSRGQRQRVAIGQSIVHSPELLVLDEPASGLDPEARSSLAGLFRRLSASGMTLLVSSHILTELEEYSTHMLALRDGRVVDFRPIHATSARASDDRRERVLDLRLHTAWPNMESTLATLGARFEANASAANHWSLTADLTDAEQAALLHKLVLAGAPLIGFDERRKTLSQTYQSTIDRTQDAAGSQA